VVRDAPDRLPLYEQLIAALDVEPQSLEIEATIIDLNTDRLRELGINWRFTRGDTSLLFGRGGASDQVLRPETPPRDVTTSGVGGFISAVLNGPNEFIARINLLEQQGAARIVSSPQVMTLSNVEAVFDNSSTFYVRVAGRDEVDLFNVSAGTTLRVTPHVFKDNGQVRIKMLVSIDDGTLSTRTVDTLPVVNRSSVNTQALIFEGESLLVGGIVRESNTSDETKVPFLGDLPLLGALFRSKATNTGRVERLFLIQPRLARSGRTVAQLNQLGLPAGASSASSASSAGGPSVGKASSAPLQNPEVLP
jgi:type III secretion protein C